MTDVVAAFDFDGTIATRDSLSGFITGTAGWTGLARSLARTSPRIAGVALGRLSRDDAKDHFLTAALAGRPAAEIEAAGRRYGHAILRAGRFHDAVLARLDEHRADGHELVIISASPDIYLRPVAERLGAALVASRFASDDEGRLTGRLEGGNCRGARKVARLEEWLGGRSVVLHAYGDSPGDRELLARADHGYLVRRGRISPVSP